MNPLEAQPDSNHTQKKSRLGPLFLVAGALALFGVLNRPTDGLDGWSTDFEAARNEATATNRPLLVAFSMYQCGPCAAMDRNVLPAQPVQEALKDFVPVYLDVDKNLEVARQFGVYSTPTYTVLDGHGQVMARTMGYHSVEEFVDFLGKALSVSSRATVNAPPSEQAAP